MKTGQPPRGKGKAFIEAANQFLGGSARESAVTFDRDE